MATFSPDDATRTPCSSENQWLPLIVRNADLLLFAISDPFEVGITLRFALPRVRSGGNVSKGKEARSPCPKSCNTTDANAVNHLL